VHWNDYINPLVAIEAIGATQQLNAAMFLSVRRAVAVLAGR
jgi:hypothetical protein